MKNSKALWESCQRYIQQNVSPEEYQKWFSGIELESYNEASLTLKLWVPSLYISDYLETHYLDLLRRTFINTFGRIRLLWHPIVAKKDESQERSQKAKQTTHGVRGTGPMMEGLNDRDEAPEVTPAPIIGNGQQSASITPQNQQLPEIDSQLNQFQKFSNFIEGSSNKLCRSVGLSIAEHPQGTKFNPMFIFGPSGCGKTHLVNAIGLKCKEIYPQKRILYVSARIFVLQFMNATRENSLNDFIAFYQTIDMLIVDDVQEWDSPTQKATHNTFFHIFNHLFRNGKRIILVSDRPPIELKNLNERLLTRFSCGLVAEMEKPNVQLCVDILRRKIARDGLVVPNDVVQYIAENANGSVRDLEGVINSLMAYSVVYNMNISMQLVERVVKRAVNMNNEPVTFDSIMQIVCEKYGVTEELIKSRTRRREIVQPRQLIIYFASKYIHMPTSRIGRKIGGRDHSTVIHSISQVEQRLKVNKDFRAEVEELEKSFQIKENS